MSVSARRPELEQVPVRVVEVVRLGVHPVELCRPVHLDPRVAHTLDGRVELVARHVEGEMDVTESLALRKGRVLLEHEWPAVECQPLLPVVLAREEPRPFI